MSLWKLLAQEHQGLPRDESMGLPQHDGKPFLELWPPSHFCQGCEAGFGGTGTEKKTA